MKKIVSTIVLVLFISTFADAQSNVKYSMSIEARSLFIDMNRYGDTIHIVYKKDLGVDPNKSEGIEQARKKLRAYFSDSLAIFSNEIERKVKQERALEMYFSFRMKFHAFISDSISIQASSNEYYLRLVDRVRYTSVDVLEKDMLAERGEFTLVFDGILILVSMTEPKKFFGATSPSVGSNPLLHSLLTQTLWLYRKDNPGSFISKDSLRIGY